MASERFSSELRGRLVELLGPDGALELMERVPQVSWHDVTTRGDLTALETRLRSDLASKVGLAELRVEIADQFREQNLRLTTTMVTTMLGGIFGAAGLAFAAARFA